MSYTEEHFPIETFLQWFLPGTVFVIKDKNWEDEEIEDFFLVLEVNPSFGIGGSWVKTKLLSSTRKNIRRDGPYEARRYYELYKNDPSLFSFPV